MFHKSRSLRGRGSQATHLTSFEQQVKFCSAFFTFIYIYFFFPFRFCRALCLCTIYIYICKSWNWRWDRGWKGDGFFQWPVTNWISDRLLRARVCYGLGIRFGIRVCCQKKKKKKMGNGKWESKNVKEMKCKEKLGKGLSL